jgi:hypothetical protein
VCFLQGLQGSLTHLPRAAPGVKAVDLCDLNDRGVYLRQECTSGRASNARLGLLKLTALMGATVRGTAVTVAKAEAMKKIQLPV